MTDATISPISESIQDQEVVQPTQPMKNRRAWSLESKLKILKDLDILSTQNGDAGAYLRRHGLYRSTISDWRKMRANGTLNKAHTKRGPESKYTPEQIANEKLIRENARLKTELERAKKLIDIQKKVAAMMEGVD